MELRLLRVLCQGGCSEEIAQEVLVCLRGYKFATIGHQILFNCLAALPRQRPELMAELLPARLIQAGFPDFDLAPYLEPQRWSAAEIRQYLETLMNVQEGRETGSDKDSTM